MSLEMRILLPLLAAILAPLSLLAEADPYQRIALAKSPELSVSLLVRPTASPADANFIGFELENHADAPLRVTNASYRLEEAQVTDLATGERLSSMYLASGNTYDLLWRDEGAPSEAPRLEQYNVAPGPTQFLRYLSLRTLSTLGIPSRSVKVTGRVRFELSLISSPLTTPREGVPFEFTWQPPEDAQLPAMRARLVSTMLNPVEAFGDQTLFEVFLAAPRLTTQLTVDQLLTGVQLRRPGLRSPLVQYINAHFPTDEKTIAFLLDAIRRYDWLMLSDFQDASNIKDARLIDPLLQWIRVDRGRTHASHFVLVMLRHQRGLMADRKRITAELGQIMLAKSTSFGPNATGPVAKDQWFRWQQELDDLALTGDENLIPVIAPLLDRRDVAVDVAELSAPGNGVSLRTCDAAYNALRTLLGLPGGPFSMRNPPRVTSIADEYARRDTLIQQLKTRLAQS